MVGMTRAHLADPHIVNKIAAGREQEIRPCVGATYCLDRLYEGHEALCIHNPATGREATMSHVLRPAPPQKRAGVVELGRSLFWERVCQSVSTTVGAVTLKKTIQ